jgi:predicted transcriptional regulator
MAERSRRRTVDLAVRVDPDLRDEIDFVARVAGVTRNEVVRVALAEYTAAALAKEPA